MFLWLHICNTCHISFIPLNIVDIAIFILNTPWPRRLGGAFLWGLRLKRKQSSSQTYCSPSLACWSSDISAEHQVCVGVNVAQLFLEHKQLTRCFSQQIWKASIMLHVPYKNGWTSALCICFLLHYVFPYHQQTHIYICWFIFIYKYINSIWTKSMTVHHNWCFYFLSIASNLYLKPTNLKHKITYTLLQPGSLGKKTRSDMKWPGGIGQNKKVIYLVLN